MTRHIRNPGRYNAAVERASRPWPGNPAADNPPVESDPEISITWLAITLDHLVEEDFLADQPDYRRAVAAAANLSRQHYPANFRALAKLALGDTAIRALVEKAGLKVSKPGDIEKVRRLLLVASEQVEGQKPAAPEAQEQPE